MNISEILKYCPKGTKLYSLVDGIVTLESVDTTKQYPIEVTTEGENTSYFTKDGKVFVTRPNGECVLFPSKDQRDWNKFRLPVKKGDIMTLIGEGFPFIANGIITKEGGLEYICGVLKEPNCLQISGLNTSCTLWTDEFCIPASKEAKKELFDKIAEAGYKWNADTLELEKIESKFKEGDVVIDGSNNICLVLKSKDSNLIVMSAILYSNTRLSIYNDINEYRHISELTLASTTNRNKFYSALIKAGYRYDKGQHLLIKQKFKPFDKVLVRNNDKQKWIPNIFLRFTNESIYKYSCIGNDVYDQCIPYEGNEYLLDTTDSPT